VRDLVALHNGMVTSPTPRGRRPSWSTCAERRRRRDARAAGRAAIDVAERQRATVERLRASSTPTAPRRTAAAGEPAPTARASSS
jgi:hypothetical protein